jgi:peroxiredoxin Q/BCP
MEGMNMTESAIGKAIPELTLKATEIDQVTLPADIAGGWALFYFYPKDDTPGCTKQACAYRDAYKKFIDAGVKVYGVSLDDMDSHGAFKSKFNLNFPLISDPDHRLSDALGVYGDHRVELPGGKVFEWTGLSRDSFLVNPEGSVVKEWRMIDPIEGVDQTFEAFKAASGG